MCCIKNQSKTLDRQTLNKLYQRKCVQLARAKASSNIVMTALYKAEAELLKSELDKLW